MHLHYLSYWLLFLSWRTNRNQLWVSLAEWQSQRQITEIWLMRNTLFFVFFKIILSFIVVKWRNIHLFAFHILVLKLLLKKLFFKNHIVKISKICRLDLLYVFYINVIKISCSIEEAWVIICRSFLVTESSKESNILIFFVGTSSILLNLHISIISVVFIIIHQLLPSNNNIIWLVAEAVLSILNLIITAECRSTCIFALKFQVFLIEFNWFLRWWLLCKFTI